LFQWNKYFAREWEDSAKTDITVDRIDYNPDDDDDDVTYRIEELIGEIGDRISDQLFTRFCNEEAEGVNYFGCRNCGSFIASILNTDEDVASWGKKIDYDDNMCTYSVTDTAGGESNILWNLSDNSVTWRDGKNITLAELREREKEQKAEHEEHDPCER
jgi:hypothetical protein